jgi:hypothetical protein
VRSWPLILADAGYGLERSPRRELLARAIHERHRVDRGSAGATSGLLVPWADLNEGERELSRSSADHIAVKLASIGCTVASAAPTDPIVTFTEPELERLARLEHDRWLEERLRLGWTQGPERNDAAKTHPDVVPWPDLPEDRRQIDRDHVRAIPELLAAVGLRIVRKRAAVPATPRRSP